MQNIVRTLVALHHTQPSLAADAPVEYVSVSEPLVLAYQRGPVLVLLNLGTSPCSVLCNDIAAGKYIQWLNDQTIQDAPSVTDISLDANNPIALDAKGFAIFVKQ